MTAELHSPQGDSEPIRLVDTVTPPPLPSRSAAEAAAEAPVDHVADAPPLPPKPAPPVAKSAAKSAPKKAPAGSGAARPARAKSAPKRPAAPRKTAASRATPPAAPPKPEVDAATAAAAIGEATAPPRAVPPLPPLPADIVSPASSAVAPDDIPVETVPAPEIDAPVDPPVAPAAPKKRAPRKKRPVASAPAVLAEPAVVSEPVAVPESEVRPEPAVAPEPEAEPAVAPEPEPEPEVAPEPEPEPDVEPEPGVIPEPEVAPEPEPAAEVLPEPEPEPDIDLEPDAEANADVLAAELLDGMADADDAPAAVRVRGLVKTFGEAVAVDGIDLTVPAGTFYGLVGPNGAGKTTTLSMISGLLRPDAGAVTVGGHDLAADAANAKRLMGVLPDRLRTFDRLTGRQLLHYYGVLRGLKPAVVESRTADLARAFDLSDALARPVSDYSAGMTKKVMLAGAMIHSPRVLVLDEPFESVDPVSSAVILDILSAYVSHGGTVILSSHGMDLVERVCDGVAVIVAGRVLAAGTVDEVRGERTLEERFLELTGGAADVEGLEWLHTFSG